MPRRPGGVSGLPEPVATREQGVAALAFREVLPQKIGDLADGGSKDPFSARDR
ncbi:hypothetical protein [Acidicapsa acidisoli]|uniref:hypothetical protein n=1 Tax=Acidicapsa acidisoli TaxID=1615681 RepID=UPI0021DFCEF0|nr:hypothetical protein [Acidicapsa acidisoli]